MNKALTAVFLINDKSAFDKDVGNKVFELFKATAGEDLSTTTATHLVTAVSHSDEISKLDAVRELVECDALWGSELKDGLSAILEADDKDLPSLIEEWTTE